MKPWENGALRVSDNHRYLQNGQTPFFWLGDTAWLMFARLSEAEADIYLRNRQEKGFNVIQATLIHEWPQSNREGEKALTEDDFARPDERSGYWQQAFRMIERAEELGLYMALLPAWGDIVHRGYLNEENCDIYLDFLLTHLRDRKNIIWLVGGDIRGDADRPVFERIGRKLKKAGGGALVGFHPFGRTSSSLWFQTADWLDFNMFQSGHRRYDQSEMKAWDDRQEEPAGADNTDGYGEDNWRYVAHDLVKQPLKPTLDGEPSYEQIRQGLHDPAQPYWQSQEIRRYMYWAVFAGACGHTYGDNAIMQFFDGERDQEGAFGVWQDWREALNNIGSACAGHLRTLLESVTYQTGSEQSDTYLAGPQSAGYQRVSIFAGADFLLAYTYTGEPFALNLRHRPQPASDFWWFDPVTGVRHYGGACPSGAAVTFKPPVKLEAHNDWVLIMR